MQPLQSFPMPTRGVVIGITTENSWPTGAERPVRLAYIATNSTDRLSFISLHSAPSAEKVERLVSRPAKFDDMPDGLVVELHLASEIVAGETIHLALAQAGATTYFPPQQIDDGQEHI